jgi:hypothetical protein
VVVAHIGASLKETTRTSPSWIPQSQSGYPHVEARYLEQEARADERRAMHVDAANGKAVRASGADATVTGTAYAAELPKSAFAGPATL